MQKTKAKHGSHWLARRLPFAALWAVTGAIMGILTNVFLATHPSEYLTPEQINILISLWNVIGGGIIKIQLVERLLKQSMRGWLVYTMIGTTISLFFSNMILSQTNPDPNVFSVLMPLIYILPALLLQTIWYWRRVHNAWVLPLATIMISLGFHGLYIISPSLVDSPLLQGLSVLSSVLIGVIIHYLWSQPRATEKAKVDLAVDNDSDEARIERLQERERSNPLWDMGDEQALQSEA